MDTIDDVKLIKANLGDARKWPRELVPVMLSKLPDPLEGDVDIPNIDINRGLLENRETKGSSYSHAELEKTAIWLNKTNGAKKPLIQKFETFPINYQHIVSVRPTDKNWDKKEQVRTAVITNQLLSNHPFNRDECVFIGAATPSLVPDIYIRKDKWSDDPLKANETALNIEPVYSNNVLINKKLLKDYKGNALLALRQVARGMYDSVTDWFNGVLYTAVMLAHTSSQSVIWNDRVTTDSLAMTIFGELSHNVRGKEFFILAGSDLNSQWVTHAAHIPQMPNNVAYVVKFKRGAVRTYTLGVPELYINSQVRLQEFPEEEFISMFLANNQAPFIHLSSDYGVSITKITALSKGTTNLDV